jgi:hypothetical protein
VHQWLYHHQQLVVHQIVNYLNRVKVGMLHVCMCVYHTRHKYALHVRTLYIIISLEHVHVMYLMYLNMHCVIRSMSATCRSTQNFRVITLYTWILQQHDIYYGGYNIIAMHVWIPPIDGYKLICLPLWQLLWVCWDLSVFCVREEDNSETLEPAQVKLTQ